MDKIERSDTAESPFVVQIFRSYAPLRAAWLQLEADGEFYPFQTFAWISKFIDTLAAALAITPILVLVSDQSGAPVVIAPLCLRRRGDLMSLEFMDCGLADYNAPLLRKGADKRPTKDEFIKLWQSVLVSVEPVDVVHLNKMPERIGEESNPFLWLNNHAHANSYQAKLTGSFDEFWQSRPVKLRQDSRRKRRRLNERGKLEFRTAHTVEEAESFTSAMIRLKSRRYRATSVKDMFEHAEYRSFYLELAREQVPHGIVSVSALMLDGTPIAAHWGLASRGRLYYIMPAFDLDNWWSYSVGRLAIEDLVRWCYEQGMQVLDFTVGDEAYKLDWAEETTPLYVHLSGRSIAGKIYVAFRATRYTTRRVARRHARLYALLKIIHMELQKLCRNVRWR
jgi:CelD/BcsL family acetyltransferase involved in cellulose biosynthesis